MSQIVKDVALLSECVVILEEAGVVRQESSQEFPAVVNVPDRIEIDSTLGRRRTERKPCVARVDLLSPTNETGFAININAQGIRVAVHTRLLENTRCAIKLTFANGASLRTAARVVWVQRTADGCIAGLEFVEASSTSSHA